MFWVFFSAPLTAWMRDSLAANATGAAPPGGPGESVMVAVATSPLLDGPLKLLFPRGGGGGLPMAQAAQAAQAAGAAVDALSAGEPPLARFPWQVLGLGDVAVPGLLAGLALRFDAQLEEYPDAAPPPIAPPGADGRAPAGSRLWAPPARAPTEAPHFAAALGAHAAGLLLAFAANAATGAGQPALLYVCPLTLAAVGGTAASRGVLGRAWEFEDDSPDQLAAASAVEAK